MFQVYVVLRLLAAMEGWPKFFLLMFKSSYQHLPCVASTPLFSWHNIFFGQMEVVVSRKGTAATYD
jgi:hypothetical protein